VTKSNGQFYLRYDVELEERNPTGANKKRRYLNMPSAESKLK